MTPLFHPQRDGHGQKRRGKPRKWCSEVCSQHARTHKYRERPDGSYETLVRVWTVPKGRGEVGALRDRHTYSYADAESTVKVALADGYFDCDQLDRANCARLGHIHGGYRNHRMYASNDQGFAAAIGAFYLTPDYVAADAEPVAVSIDGDVGRYVEDVAATDYQEVWGPRAALMSIPNALLRYLTGHLPPPARAVAMLGTYAAMENDREVAELYRAFITQWPEYADAQVSEADVLSLIDDPSQP